MPVIDTGSDVFAAGAETAAAVAPTLAGSSGMSAPSMAEMVANLTPDNCAEKITDLKRKALEMRKERRDVAKQLKNVQKKQRRLKEKARQLTDEDLLSVIMMRRAPKNVAAEPARASGANEPLRSEAPGAAASNAASPSDGDAGLAPPEAHPEL